jgi:membrane protease subunit HflC|tara:strand:+ start:1121 stop:2044 length:924 start_codon:yes stop_codon:yes gene_type:complete
MFFKYFKILFLPIIIVVAMNSFFIVNEFQQAIVLQFGRPISSKTTAGIAFKLPFLQNVIKFDKRILEWDGDATEVPTKGMLDKRATAASLKKEKQETTNIFIDTFARWRISDPLKFYISVNNEKQAQSRLDGILDGKIRDKIAPQYIDDIVIDSDRIMAEALESIKLEFESLDIGIEVLGIEIKRLTFNNKIMPQVFDRMASEQEAEAAKFEGQGKAKRSEILGIIDREVDLIISTANKDAKVMEGVADSTAAATYAIAYQNDPDFYELWKTFDVLPDAIGSKSIFWLSTQNYPNSNIFGIRPEALK